MALDLKDKKVLRELFKDSRQTDKSIGKKAGISKEVVGYRIRRLEDEGYIQGYVGIINNAALGFEQYTIAFALRELSDDFNSYVCHLENCLWIATCIGQWNVLMTILVRKKEEVEEVVAALMQRFRSLILSYEISLRLEGVCRPNIDFLIKETKRYDPKVKKGAHLDVVDEKLLRFLSCNGRATAVAISKSLSVSADTVAYRIRRLVASGIIIGFQAHIDIENFRKLRYLLFLEFNNLKASEEKLREFCRRNPAVHYCDKVLSRYNVRLEVTADSHEGLAFFLSLLRNTFRNEIKPIESMLVIMRELKHVTYFCSLPPLKHRLPYSTGQKKK